MNFIDALKSNRPIKRAGMLNFLWPDWLLTCCCNTVKPMGVSCCCKPLLKKEDFLAEDWEIKMGQKEAALSDITEALASLNPASNASVLLRQARRRIKHHLKETSDN